MLYAHQWQDFARIREVRHIDDAIRRTMHLNGNNEQERERLIRFVLGKATEEGRVGLVVAWMIANRWVCPCDGDNK